MSILYPTAWFGLIGVPLAVLIALWRARRQDISVPSMLFWERLSETMAEGGERRRQIVDIPLVLAGAFALLAVLGAAGPVSLEQTGSGRHIVFAVDLSAGMRAVSTDGTVYERLQEQVRQALEHVRPEDRVSIVPWPPQAGDITSRQPPQIARDRLLSLRPVPLPGDISEAVPTALAMIAPEETAACVIFTDDPAALVSRMPPNVSVVSAGDKLDNTGIVAMDIDDDRVYAAVLNHGAERSVNVSLTPENAEPRTRRLNLPADSRIDCTWPLPDTTSTKLTLSLDTSDALADDDTAVAVRRRRGTTRVALFGPESEPLRRAFNAIDAVAVTRMADADAVTGDFDLNVFYSVMPEALPPGSSVLVAPGGNIGPLQTGPEVSPGDLIVRAESPLSKGMDLSGVTVTRLRPAEAAGLRPIVSCSAGTAIGLLTSDETSLIYVGFDFAPATTNWPLMWSFPAFWNNVVRFARESTPKEWTTPRGEAAANLLDETESTLTGELKTFSPGMLGAVPSGTTVGMDFSLIAGGTALAAALAHWCLKR